MSKWANRLRATPMKAENSEVGLDLALTKADETRQKVVSSAFVSGQFRASSENNDLGRKRKPFEKINQRLNPALTKTDETKDALLTERLNRMIEAGASFDVTAEDFQIVGAGNLTEAMKEFLTANRIAVLCTLQQALLMKHLFSAQLELLEIYIDKVNEQNARFETVCGITRNWFARLLETMPNREEFQN